MGTISFDEIIKNRIFKFDGNVVPINERLAVMNFSDLKHLLSGNVVIRSAVYCLIIVEKGSATVSINGISHKLKRHDLACTIPGDTISWDSPEKSDLKATFIFFEDNILLAVLTGNFTLEPVAFMNSEYHYPFIRLSEKRFRKLSELAIDINECLNEIPVFWDLIRCQLWQFVFLAEKEYVVNGNEGRKKENKNLIPSFINLVNKYFKVSHDARFYADKLNITPAYLNKTVNHALNMNAHDYILNRVMSEAKLLLRLTDISVSEVAYTLGFNDPNYFIRCFKKSENMTPKDFQKHGTL